MLHQDLETSIDRVLDIPELLSKVFELLDDEANAVNAQVSRKWSEIALDYIWCDVEDLYHLFTILAPMHKSIETNVYVSVLCSDLSHGF